MPLNLNDLLKKAEKKGMIPQTESSPLSTPAHLIRPWQQESVLYAEADKKEENNPGKNLSQSRAKLEPKLSQSRAKLEPNLSQSRAKLEPKLSQSRAKLEPKLEPKLSQSRAKVEPK